MKNPSRPKLTVTHSWYGDNGLIDIMNRSMAELSFSMAAISQERLDFLSFMPVSFTIEFAFYFLSPLAFGTPSALIKPFSISVWISVGISIALTLLISWAFLSFEKMKNVRGFMASLEYTFGMFSQQGHTEDIYLNGTKLKSVTLNILMFTFIVYYSNMALTGLLLPSPKEIDSFQKLLNSKIDYGILDTGYLRNFKLGVPYGPDTPLRRTWMKIIHRQERIFYDTSTGLENLLNGGFAMYCDDWTMKSALFPIIGDSEACSLTLVQMHKSPKVHTFPPVSKGSTLRQSIAVKVIWMQEVGLRDFSLKSFLPEIPPCYGANRVTIGLKSLQLAYACLFVGMTISLIIYFTEFIRNKCQIERSRI